jgi:hypothetical protein
MQRNIQGNFALARRPYHVYGAVIVLGTAPEKGPSYFVMFVFVPGFSWLGVVGVSSSGEASSGEYYPDTAAKTAARRLILPPPPPLFSSCAEDLKTKIPRIIRICLPVCFP